VGLLVLVTGFFGGAVVYGLDHLGVTSRQLIDNRLAQ
jgi:hypothetical protein